MQSLPAQLRGGGHRGSFCKRGGELGSTTGSFCKGEELGSISGHFPGGRGGLWGGGEDGGEGEAGVGGGKEGGDEVGGVGNAEGEEALVFEEVGETSKGGFEGVEGGEVGGGAGAGGLAARQGSTRLRMTRRRMAISSSRPVTWRARA